MDRNRSARRISPRLPFKTTMRVRDSKTGRMEQMHKLTLFDSEKLREPLLRTMPAEQAAPPHLPPSVHFRAPSVCSLSQPRLNSFVIIFRS